MPSKNGPLRIGIGGPVGSGKTALTDKLCKAMREKYSVAVVTNDIYTKEDAEALVRMQALPSERIVGVETGGCPHTAIREDASINLQAIADLNRRDSPSRCRLHRVGEGDNLAATFSPDLADAYDLCDLGSARRGNSAQGRAGDHQVRSAGDHQEGSRPLRRCRPRGS